MGRRGPKPEPAAVKLAKGNSGHRPIGADPQVEADGQQSGRVAAPAWLKGEARKIWERLAPRMIGLKLLTATDAYTFARYCTNFADWLTLQRRLKTKGRIYEIETASGRVRRADPAFVMAYQLDKRLEAVEDRFGLNPAERQRIFAARAQMPHTGDLFSDRSGAPAKPADPAQPAQAADVFDNTPESPVGMLN